MHVAGILSPLSKQGKVPILPMFIYIKSSLTVMHVEVESALFYFHLLACRRKPDGMDIKERDLLK